MSHVKWNDPITNELKIAIEYASKKEKILVKYIGQSSYLTHDKIYYAFKEIGKEYCDVWNIRCDLGYIRCIMLYPNSSAHGFGRFVKLSECIL